MKATITVGISASGKTTWAKAHAQATGAIISNRDDLRFSNVGRSGLRTHAEIAGLIRFGSNAAMMKRAAALHVVRTQLDPGKGSG